MTPTILILKNFGKHNMRKNQLSKSFIDLHNDVTTKDLSIQL